MVPADSRRIPRVPRYSGGRCTARLFAYRTITFCGATFQYASAQDGTCDCHGSYNPESAPEEQMRFGLFPVRSPLLGESLLFSSPAGTKMFQFPAFASAVHRQRMSAIRLTGCPIRKSAHHRICAPTRGLSQLITSFIAFVSLGIRHAPLVTF